MNKSARYTRWMAVGDTHGDMIDWPAANAALDFAKHFKPHRKIHAGDYTDLRPLRGGASLEEKQEGIAADIEAAETFLAKYQPTDVLDGNHDYRLMRAIAGKDELVAELGKKVFADLAKVIGKAKRYPWCKRRGVLQLGDQRLIHGYHSGLTAAKQAAAVYGNVLMWHVHSVDVYSQPGLEDRIGRACGCLCRVDMDYNRGQVNTLRQSHGFAYGLTMPSGKNIVCQARPIDGVWFFPSEFREFREFREVCGAA